MFEHPWDHWGYARIKIDNEILNYFALHAMVFVFLIVVNPWNDIELEPTGKQV